MNLCCTPHPNMEGGYDVIVMHLLVAPRGEVVRRGKIIVLHFKIFKGDVYENVTSKYNFSLLEVFLSLSCYFVPVVVQCGKSILNINCYERFQSKTRE